MQQILQEVGLAHKMHDKAGELSHGQQRALEVAITLATSPTLLLLDEPTQGLSPEATQEMVRLIKRLGSATPSRSSSIKCPLCSPSQTVSR